MLILTSFAFVFVVAISEWPNSLLVLYSFAGVSCIFLCLMWFYTLRFFSMSHPNKRFHDSHKYRVPEHINTGQIVCCFLVSCGIFGGVTISLIHNLIFICVPPENCTLLPYYVVSITSAMGIIMFIFLCLNCLCYRHYVQRNAGSMY